MKCYTHQAITKRVDHSYIFDESIKIRKSKSKNELKLDKMRILKDKVNRVEKINMSDNHSIKQHYVREKQLPIRLTTCNPAMLKMALTNMW